MSDLKPEQTLWVLLYGISQIQDALALKTDGVDQRGRAFIDPKWGMRVFLAFQAMAWWASS